MSKGELLSRIFQHKKFNQIINNVCKGSRHTDDLISEVNLILCELDEDKLFKMWNNKYIWYWLSNVVTNLFYSTSSPFYKKYRQKSNEYIDCIYLYKDDSNIEELELIQKIEHIIDNNFHWSDAYLFKLYYIHNIDEWGNVQEPLSTRKIEKLLTYKDLKMDHTKVHKNVKKTLIELKEILKKENIKYGDNNIVD